MRIKKARPSREKGNFHVYLMANNEVTEMTDCQQTVVSFLCNCDYISFVISIYNDRV